MQIPCVYIPGPAPAVSVANIHNYSIRMKIINLDFFRISWLKDTVMHMEVKNNFFSGPYGTPLGTSVYLVYS
jgi:hypothetical protein